MQKGRSQHLTRPGRSPSVVVIHEQPPGAAEFGNHYVEPSIQVDVRYSDVMRAVDPAVDDMLNPAAHRRRISRILEPGNVPHNLGRRKYDIRAPVAIHVRYFD